MSDPQTELSSEERRHDRYEGRLEARLLVAGGWWCCWIRDISPGGAGLEPAIPAALGRRVALSSPFFDFEGELNGRVVNVSDNKTCIEFELDQHMNGQLARFLAHNT